VEQCVQRLGTQRQVADWLEIEESSISRWINEKEAVPDHTRRLLALAFGLHLPGRDLSWPIPEGALDDRERKRVTYRDAWRLLGEIWKLKTSPDLEERGRWDLIAGMLQRLAPIEEEPLPRVGETTEP
jgi:hypothetical protein